MNREFLIENLYAAIKQISNTYNNQVHEVLLRCIENNLLSDNDIKKILFDCPLRLDVNKLQLMNDLNKIQSNRSKLVLMEPFVP